MNKPGNILIVDDTPENLRLLTKILSEHGYNIRVAASGSHALATIKKEHPDLILLDIMMPEINGFEVCSRLKGDKDTQGIPVIFLSALHDVNDKVKAFQAGGVDYVSKPFQEQEVLARIRTHLKLHDLQIQLEEKNRQLNETNEQIEKRNSELHEALDNIKTLQGLIPICANCKSIRDDNGFWKKVESYITEHSEAEFSHGICPECTKKLYPEYTEK